MTIEEMIMTGQLRFNKNGKVDGRCVAMKNKIVDKNGNDLRSTRKSAKEEKYHEQEEPVAVEATTSEKDEQQKEVNNNEFCESFEKLDIADIYDTEEINILRDRILNETAPRVFGTIMEILLEKILIDEGHNIKHPTTIHYDRYSNIEKKIEIKNSRVKRKRNKLTKYNIFEILTLPSYVKFEDRLNEEWDCNIQQIKPNEFDILYYGLLFYNKIVIFKISNDEIEGNKSINYSNKQHKGNIGEGQFHIKNNNFEYHYTNHKFKELSWIELYNILSN